MSEQIQKVAGYNVSSTQAVMAPKLEHSILNIPSISTPSFGNILTFDLKNKGYKIHELSIMMTPSAITGITSPPTNYPCYIPADFWVLRYEVLVNGVVVQNINGMSNWIQNQFYRADEARAITNSGMGDYSSVANRFTMSDGTVPWIISLKSLFNKIHFNLIENSHEIQLKCYLNSSGNVISQSSGTGTPVATLQSASLIARVSRLDNDMMMGHRNFLSKTPRSYFYYEMKNQNATATSGSTATTITLTNVVGNVSYLFFIVRPTASLIGENTFSFSKIRDFNILDNAGTSLVGGSVIPDKLSLQLTKMWSQSSYINDQMKGISNSNIYMWSFSPDPVRTHHEGLLIGSKQFFGNENIQITFTGALGASVSIDVFAYTSAVLTQKLNGVDKENI